MRKCPVCERNPPFLSRLLAAPWNPITCSACGTALAPNYLYLLAPAALAAAFAAVVFADLSLAQRFGILAAGVAAYLAILAMLPLRTITTH